MMLAGRVVTGAMLLVGARLMGRLIDFCALLVFARLLTPNDFGVVAAAMTLISLMEAIFELPVGLVLVRTPNVEPDHYDTAFTLSMLRGVMLGLLIAGIAWPYAWAFDDFRLVPIILCLGWAPMIRGCVSPHLWINLRQLQMGPDCLAQTVGKVGAFVVAMLALALERNYWALVVATVSSPAIMVATSYYLAPYRPRLSLRQWRIFWDFLCWLGGAQFLAALSWQCDRFVLGQLSSRAELGRYTMADSLAALPIQALAAPAAAMLFPALGAIHVQHERLRRAFLIGLGGVYTLCLPIMVGLIVLAEPFCRTVLGPQWGEVVLPMQMLTAAGALSLIAQPLGALYNALGQTKAGMVRSILGLSIKLPLVLVGCFAGGLAGVALARLVTEFIMFVVSAHSIRQLTGASTRNILSVLLRPAGASGAMILALLVLQPLIESSDDQTIRGLILAALVLAGALVYSATILTLWVLAGRPAGLEARLTAIVHETLRRIASRQVGLSLGSKVIVPVEVHGRPNQPG
ncbi:oligosaccharide flippase family protein [Methylobacterium sp. M6A4_1b]